MVTLELLGDWWIADFIADILGWLLFTMTCGLMIIPTSEIYLGQQITLKQVIQRYLARVDVYFSCSIIYVVVLHLPELYNGIESVSSNGLVLVMFGVFIIGISIVIFLLISWIFYGPVLMIENTTVKEAFGRSRYLVYGKWWRTLWNVIKLHFLLWSIRVYLINRNLIKLSFNLI